MYVVTCSVSGDKNKCYNFVYNSPGEVKLGIACSHTLCCTSLEPASIHLFKLAGLTICHCQSDQNSLHYLCTEPVHVQYQDVILCVVRSYSSDQCTGISTYVHVAFRRRTMQFLSSSVYPCTDCLLMNPQYMYLMCMCVI